MCSCAAHGQRTLLSWLTREWVHLGRLVKSWEPMGVCDQSLSYCVGLPSVQTQGTEMPGGR